MTQQALAVIATALLLAPAPAAQQPDTIREIEVPMQQGRLDVADLARALLDAYGFDGDALALPEHEVDLSGIRGYALLLGARKALRGTVQFTRAGDGSALTIRVDRVRARELRRAVRVILEGSSRCTGQTSASVPMRAGLDSPRRRGVPSRVRVLHRRHTRLTQEER